MAGRKQKTDEAPKGAPSWMTTFADMMTLLLTFFVLLVSMSTMEIEKFKAAAASLKGAFSVLPFQDRPRPQPLTPRDRKGEKRTERRRARAVSQLKSLIREKNLQNVVKVTQKNEGIHITIGDPALFDSGKALIKFDFMPILDSIVDIIDTGTGSENIRIEGHTDNVPIHTEQFNDNWELSIGRALTVIRYIRSKQTIDPKRLRPVGCGEFHPVSTNETPEGRALNRRVEIFIDFSE
ncbi:flagellar motor protein MotB [Candidatus Latescibacterota bacterium]